MDVLAGLARVALRLGTLPVLAGANFLDFQMSRAGGAVRSRTDWLQRTAHGYTKWLGLNIRVHGEVPTHGLIVSNHISYLDIVGLSAVAGCAFVSKKEVADWPLFGTCAKAGATIFLDRERRGAVAGVADQMKGLLDEGIPLVLFPEGTSTDSREILPFRSSLLQPVVDLDHPVTACGLRYSLQDSGSVPDEVAYWGDMEVFPHMLNLLTKTGVNLDIHFGPTLKRTADRKTLARDLHAEVSALAAG